MPINRPPSPPDLDRIVMRRLDDRSLAVPAFVADRLGLHVRVHSDILKCVVFVGIENDRGTFVPLGTGFLASCRFSSNSGRFNPFDVTLLITAEHNTENIRGPDLHVRINRTGGGTSVLKLNLSERISDKTIDTAIFLMSPLHDAHEYKTLIFKKEYHELAIQTLWKPNIGDETATVGLYTSHHGETKNLPIVRIGNIAAMPDEPVRIDSGTGNVRGYIVEVRSIAGLSGSPVFLNIPNFRVVNGLVQSLDIPEDRIGAFPIGMMLGYHVVRSNEDLISVPQWEGAVQEDARNAPSQLPDERNTGLAVIVPIEEILNLFYKNIDKVLRAANVGHEEAPKSVG